LRYTCALIFLLACLLISCKSSRIQSKVIKNTDESALLKSITSHNIDFEYFSARAKINFKSSYESGRVNANVIIKKDDIIYMQFKRFGLQLASMKITPDSIWVVYNFEQYYERGPIQEYSDLYGIDLEFDKIQSFLVGNVLLPEPSEISTSNNKHIHQLESVAEGYDVSYILDAHNNLNIQSHKIIDDKGREVIIQYSDYREIEGKVNFSHSRKYFAPLDINDIGTATIDLSSVQFDKVKKIPFRIPSHYTTFD